MRLRNKKTGEIREYGSVGATTFSKGGVLESFAVYGSLAELNEEWEDYEGPKNFWCIDYEGDVGIEDERYEEHLDKIKKIGNYFNTPEEAEKAVEKLKAWKRLKDKGFEFAGWDMRNSDGGYEPSIGFELNGVTEVLDKYEIPLEIVQDLGICFGGEE